ncbi:MAG: Uma2 family endonuclease [Cytophagaceae bacterium]|nr:Uma2 family endonuclease [Cytophagaceae bacterium]
MEKLNKPAATGTLMIPKMLVLEEMDGQPIYYRGYRDVLNGEKTIEEIMGSSIYQAYLVNLIATYLTINLPKRKFWVLSNEAGLHLRRGNNLNNDIALIRRERMPNLFSDQYLDVPPDIAIEVDTKADFSEGMSESEYYQKKTRKLLDFGVEKVIWIYTKNQQIQIAERSNPTWHLTNWAGEVAVTEGCSFILNTLLADDGAI